MAEMLSTQEVADRLGVKPETVYAYVSRGLLTSRSKPGGRGSVFDAKDVDALLRRGRRARPARSVGSSGGVDSIRTAITLIAGEHYYYRGLDAVELAAQWSFETAATWLWTGEVVADTRFSSPPDSVAAARRAVAALPRHRGLLDVVRVATVAAAVADPVRFDVSPDVAVASAASLIGTVVDAIPGAAGVDSQTSSAGVAVRLWGRLATAPADQPWLDCLDAALVLLMDHGLAASTLAARVAASARADPYAVVTAALGALEGPLHGAASALAHDLLRQARDRGAAAVVSEYLREGRRIPGLGHRIYPGADPRAVALLQRLTQIPAAAPLVEVAGDVVETAARHVELHANVDLALAVLTLASGMPADAGEAIFAIARTVGWVAHALEEYGERPLRMRPSGVYTGPRPPQPVPRVTGR
jgi:citrate synthase